MTLLLFILQLGATLMMAGVIWVVQLQCYPMFLHIPDEVFCECEVFHQRRISVVVIPLMVVELATAIFLPFLPNPTWVRMAFGLGLVLLVIIWLTTLIVNIPCHRHLERERNLGTIKTLIVSNWIRTILWQMRAFLLLVLTLRGLMR